MVENGPTPYYLKFRECFVTGNKWPFAFRFHVTFVTFRQKNYLLGKGGKQKYINILLRESWVLPVSEQDSIARICKVIKKINVLCTLAINGIIPNMSSILIFFSIFSKNNI